jgi:RecA/RadA recombinase
MTLEAQSSSRRRTWASRSPLISADTAIIIQQGREIQHRGMTRPKDFLGNHSLNFYNNIHIDIFGK